MPKAKPTQVIVHRISAGEWERQNILKPVADVAKNAKIVSTAALAVVCVGVGMAGDSAYWFLKVTSGWVNAFENEVAERKSNLKSKWDASTPRFDDTSAAGKLWIWLTN